MKIMIGDTIVTTTRKSGSSKTDQGALLTVRFPENGNRRDQVHRKPGKTPCGTHLSKPGLRESPYVLVPISA